MTQNERLISMLNTSLSEAQQQRLCDMVTGFIIGIGAQPNKQNKAATIAEQTTDQPKKLAVNQ